jgi:hypothetical protein
VSYPYHYNYNREDLRRVPGGEKPLADQRRGLLAKIHVAKAQMSLTDDQYEAMLTAFKVKSAGDMTIIQLENFVKLLKDYGWQSAKSRKEKPEDAQLIALRDRVREESLKIDNGALRLPGLVKKICGVDILFWCKDVEKLERLLAVLGKLKADEECL